MAIRGKGTTLKFTPAGGAQVTVGKLTKVGEIAPEAEEVDEMSVEGLEPEAAVEPDVTAVPEP